MKKLSKKALLFLSPEISNNDEYYVVIQVKRNRSEPNINATGTLALTSLIPGKF